ncbi:MAG: shikimate dehydrogenase [Pseudomonadota bacterium]
MTKLLGVIGDPIAHSLSPLIHNGWFRDLGFDASYEAMQVADGTFGTALRTLESRNILGVNVTLPHKQAALEASHTVSQRAAGIGAANTLTFAENGKWHADNTDAPGFVSAIGNLDPDTDKAVIFGAGGSARAVVFALVQADIDTVILNRTRAKATALANDLGAEQTHAGAIDQYKDYIEGATIVINTTSAGHSGFLFELPGGRQRRFFDLSYGSVAAPQLDHASEMGWRAQDGLGMLVGQAAHSFQSWFGEWPDTESALRRCEMAVRAAL